MKKILIALLVLSGCFLFTGCDFLMDLLTAYVENSSDDDENTSGSNTEETADYSDYENASVSFESDNVKYLKATKLSNTFDSAYSGSSVYLINYNAGNYTASLNYAKSAFDDESIPPLETPFFNDTTRISEENQKIIDYVNSQDFSRTAADTTTTLTTSNPETYVAGDRKAFYIQTDSKGTQKQKYATCKAVGEKCYIWYIDDADSSLGVTASLNTETNGKNAFQRLAEKFDGVYEREINVFGSNIPTVDTINGSSYYFFSVDKNFKDKIHIVIHDLFGDAASTQESGTLGFVYTGDLYLQSAFGSNNSTKSNECEMFYLDSYFLTKWENMAVSTLSHEFNHMLNFVNKYINKGSTSYSNNQFDTWYTEMLSMSCEELMQDYLEVEDEKSPKGRLNIFNLNPSYGFTEKCWETCKNNNMSGTFDYANTYAFGTYLMHNYGGAKLMKTIANNSYVNEESITKALQALGYDETFESVFLKFAIICINPSAVPGEKDISLNRQVKSVIGNYVYYNDPIDLNDYTYTFEMYDKTKEGYEKTYSYIIEQYGYNCYTKDTQSNTITLKGPFIWKKGQYSGSYQNGFFINYYKTLTDSDLTLTLSQLSRVDNIFSYICVVK